MKEKILLEQMNDQQKILFLEEMRKIRKRPWLAVVLCLTLGGVGAHHYYLRNRSRAVVYTTFFWTLIPAVVALFESLTLARKVREYNDTMALNVAATVKNAFARW